MNEQHPDSPTPDAGTSGHEVPRADENGEQLNVSPASPSDVEDRMPDWQPGEGPGPTPGE